MEKEKTVYLLILAQRQTDGRRDKSRLHVKCFLSYFVKDSYKVSTDRKTVTT